MRLTKLFEDFFRSERSGGIVLICCTVLSLTLANSNLQADYLQVWQYRIAGHDLVYWINDALMAVFFLLIGLELEREVYIGELSDLKGAALPIIAACGGMIVPALIYTSMNYGTPAQPGAGIPIATDIAFAVGVLSLLGNRVPASLKVFLTALAVIDDLGAILVIAVFYTSSLALLNLVIALAIFAGLLLLNRFRVRLLTPYLIGGVAMWYFMLHSGIHATITGVLLAFTIPFGKGSAEAPSARLQKFLHRPVAFIILPLFALANTGIVFDMSLVESLAGAGSLGIIAGLVLGKPVGIFLFSWLGVKFRISALPSDLRWNHIIGTGFLAGIGFTMSIFIAMLAFGQAAVIGHAKLSVLFASLVAGTIGFIWMNISLKKT